ncbi:dihydrodipicolinate synthase family protein [Saccharopolyspora erythraea]|uniref:dihydrodipicolinate synthase family protein n=1 Tax=Saccharopolyspora erythraea TaxID=1836 RepID=UPI001BA683F0|nr:dihydrodipicolinate synthase family protein [Saccharopolyspora erythraea]QUH04258.1 dihydrodipicolinate synthase family protein [Saccharopolyspora erythraea]
MVQPGPQAEVPIAGGVVPPLCTPLTPERELDVPSLEKLTGHLLGAGVHGLFVTGSTGEAGYLPDSTRHRVLEVVAGVSAGEVPVLAGVIDTATPRVVEQARSARRHGADALVATAPFYVPTHPAEIAVHFRRIRSAVDLPLLAYDIPVSVGTKLAPDTVAELAEDGTLAGLKDSSDDLDGIRTVLETVDTDRFLVFSGSETMADTGLRLGAHGLVPGLGNVDPDGYLRLHRAAASGDWVLAESEQVRLRRLFHLIKVGMRRPMSRYSSAIGAFKEALVARGVIEHGTTSVPMIPLDEAERAEVRRFLVEAALLPE